MSLLLTSGTSPHGLCAKTMGIGAQELYLGDYEISMTDFLELAHYVLTNTNLEGDDDPRLQFVKSVKAMKVVDGHRVIIAGKNVPTKRLATEVTPVL